MSRQPGGDRKTLADRVSLFSERLVYVELVAERLDGELRLTGSVVAFHMIQRGS